MFTVMVGYQEALPRDESLAKHLLDKQRSVIRKTSSGQGGRYFGEELAAAEGTGLKGWLTGGTVKIREMKLQSSESVVLFESALGATRCAVEIQRMLRDYNREAPSNKDIYVRIGIHAGDVTERDGEVSGEAVAIASRVAPLAEPGGICVSERVYSSVRDKYELPIIKLGKQDLKNLELPIEVYRLALPWEKQAAVERASLDPHRLAILPLVNMTNDPNDEYFADGMTEEMISTLSNISGLAVISRTSTMQYKGAKKNLVDIGRELGAGTLLEGSVRKAGNRVRITVQLLDASEDKHLWAQSYDRELQDIFAVQSDIAARVAEALKVRLLENEAAKINRKPTENTEAYMLYLKGRQYWNKRSESAVRRAIEYFQLAIDGDPNFALAFVGIADCWSVIESWRYASSSEAVPKMKQAVLRALKLDSTLAEAHTTYALELALYEWKWEEAELEFKRAIELNPNYATAHHWYSYSVLRFTRRLDEALKEAQKALELDPLAPVMSLNMGQTLYFREQYDEAIEHYQKALSIDPNFLLAYLGQAQCHMESSRYDKGIELFETYLPRLNTETRAKLALAGVYGTGGRIEDARRLLAEVDRAEDKEQIPPVEFADAYFGLGETDRMFEYLDRAAVRRDTALLWTLIDPSFVKRYRSDPRFLAIKGKVGI